MRSTHWHRLRLLGGAGILGLLGWRLGSGPFLDAFHVVDGPALAAALVIGAVTTVCSAWRWSLVASLLGVRLPVPAAVGDYYRALFLNAVLPGGVLGDVNRAVRHGRDVGDIPLAARAVVLERAAGQVVLLAAAAAVALARPSALPLPRIPWAIAATAAVAATAIGAGAIHRHGTRWARALRGWAVDARRTLRAGTVGIGVLTTSAVVLAGHLATFVVAARTAGSVTPFTRLAPLLLLALLAMSIPLNIGGWGPREGVTAWAFAAAGLSAGQGLTVALVYGVFALVASLPGAAVLALPRITRRATAA